MKKVMEVTIKTRMLVPEPRLISINHTKLLPPHRASNETPEWRVSTSELRVERGLLHL